MSHGRRLCLSFIISETDHILTPSPLLVRPPVRPSAKNMCLIKYTRFLCGHVYRDCRLCHDDFRERLRMGCWSGNWVYRRVSILEKCWVCKRREGGGGGVSKL
jgi:hypothetical protein